MPDSSIAIYFLHNYARGLFPALTKLARSEKVVPKDSLFYQVQLEGLDPKQSKLLPIAYSLFPTANDHITIIQY